MMNGGRTFYIATEKKANINDAGEQEAGCSCMVIITFIQGEITMLNKPEFWFIDNIDHRDMRVVNDVNDVHRYTFLFTTTQLVVIHEQWTDDENNTDLEINIHRFDLENLGYITTDPWGKPRGLYMPQNKIESVLVLDGEFPPEQRQIMTKEALCRLITGQHGEVKVIESGGTFRHFDRNSRFPDDWETGDVVAVVIRQRKHGNLSGYSEITIVEICE